VIVERKPAALWRLDGREVLIDDSGRPIVDVARGSDTGLPVVTGTGAGPAAPTLLSLVVQYPRLKAMIIEARRIEDRRWNLMLAHGVAALLPADGISAALARLEGYRSAGLLQPQARLGVLDLRLSDRLVVRRASDGPAAAVSARPSGARRHAQGRQE
jgi:cell division septal protein FtsQ